MNEPYKFREKKVKSHFADGWDWHFGPDFDVYYNNIYLGTIINPEPDGYKIGIVEFPSGKKTIPANFYEKMFKSRDLAAIALHKLWKKARINTSMDVTIDENMKTNLKCVDNDCGTQFGGEPGTDCPVCGANAVPESGSPKNKTDNFSEIPETDPFKPALERVKRFTMLCKRIKELEASGENPEELNRLSIERRKERPIIRSIIDKRQGTSSHVYPYLREVIKNQLKEMWMGDNQPEIGGDSPICKFCKKEKALPATKGWFFKSNPTCQSCLDKMENYTRGLDRLRIRDEGYGGTPGKDKAFVKRHRWTVKWKQENMKQNKLRNVIQECITEVINENGEEDEIKLIGRIRDIALKSKDLTEPHLQQGVLATIYGLINQLIAMRKNAPHAGNPKGEPEDAYGQRGYMGYTPTQKPKNENSDALDALLKDTRGYKCPKCGNFHHLGKEDASHPGKLKVLNPSNPTVYQCAKCKHKWNPDNFASRVNAQNQVVKE
jgi:hypothetical protein